MVLTCLVPLLAGCEPEEPPAIQLNDLGPNEYTYIYRLVTLERAKAVALVDRKTGVVLLDSLATAWGDSALADTRTLVPVEPMRAGQVNSLLLRILEAEADSLVHAPRPDRLQSPLPDPLPAVPEEETAEKEEPAKN